MVINMPKKHGYYTFTIIKPEVESNELHLLALL